MNDGYEDADEVSFATMTTTPDFLKSLSGRDEKMDAPWTNIQKQGE